MWSQGPSVFHVVENQFLILFCDWAFANGCYNKMTVLTVVEGKENVRGSWNINWTIHTKWHVLYLTTVYFPCKVRSIEIGNPKKAKDYLQVWETTQCVLYMEERQSSAVVPSDHSPRCSFICYFLPAHQISHLQPQLLKTSDDAAITLQRQYSDTFIYTDAFKFRNL